MVELQSRVYIYFNTGNKCMTDIYCITASNMSVSFTVVTYCEIYVVALKIQQKIPIFNLNPAINSSGKFFVLIVTIDQSSLKPRIIYLYQTNKEKKHFKK